MDPIDEPDSTVTVRFSMAGQRKLDQNRRAPVLLVMFGTDLGSRIPLTTPTVTLGRTEEADIVIRDPQISRRHAAIHCDLERAAYYIEDLASTNGTMVNEKPVKEAALREGDKIFIGGTVLKFLLLDQIDLEHSQAVDELAFRDDLTGLISRKRFYDDLRLQFERAKKQRKSIGLLMMDLDGLKQINDAHGHFTGASIIARAGGLIGEITNPRGQACRFGGDEFVAYLLEHDIATCREIGERIRMAILEHPFEKDGKRLKVSISIGAAASSQDFESVAALNEHADAALYRAKANGRNCVSD